jgi:hypothetical protein
LRLVKVTKQPRSYGEVFSSRINIMSRLNVGNLDRLLRILFGLSLIGLAATDTIGVWGFLGIVPLLTGMVARCPLYSVLGVATTAR